MIQTGARLRAAQSESCGYFSLFLAHESVRSLSVKNWHSLHHRKRLAGSFLILAWKCVPFNIGTVSKATLGKLKRRDWEYNFLGFSESRVPSWTDPNCEGMFYRAVVLLGMCGNSHPLRPDSCEGRNYRHGETVHQADVKKRFTVILRRNKIWTMVRNDLRSQKLDVLILTSRQLHSHSTKAQFLAE